MEVWRVFYHNRRVQVKGGRRGAETAARLFGWKRALPPPPLYPSPPNKKIYYSLVYAVVTDETTP